jgi:hypothetical protein
MMPALQERRKCSNQQQSQGLGIETWSIRPAQNKAEAARIKASLEGLILPLYVETGSCFPWLQE